MKKKLLLFGGLLSIIIMVVATGCGQQAPAPAPAPVPAPAPAPAIAPTAKPAPAPAPSPTAAPAPAPAAKPIILRGHAHVATDNEACVRFRWWGDQVTQRSGGRVQFQYFYAESLAKSADLLKALKSGLYDVGTLSPFYWPSDMPLLNITEQPWTVTFDAEALNKAYTDFVKTAPVQEELKKNNVHFFYGVNPGGSRWVGTAKKQINTVNDLRGLKLRESGGFATLLQRAGANPVAMATSEVYDAISKGTLDGASGPLSGFVSWSYYEVCKFYSLMSLGPGEMLWAMNLDSWNNLPPDIQKIMDDVSVDFSAYAGKAGDQFVKDGLAKIQKAGVKVVPFPPEEQAKIDKIAGDLSKEYAAQLDAKGMPGTQLRNVFNDALIKYSKK